MNSESAHTCVCTFGFKVSELNLHLISAYLAFGTCLPILSPCQTLAGLIMLTLTLKKNHFCKCSPFIARLLRADLRTFPKCAVHKALITSVLALWSAGFCKPAFSTRLVPSGSLEPAHRFIAMCPPCGFYILSLCGLSLHLLNPCG